MVAQLALASPAPPSAPAPLAIESCHEERLLAQVLRGADAVVAARRVLEAQLGLRDLSRASIPELTPLVGAVRASAVACAFELGRRVVAGAPDREWIVRAPADVAERLLPAMRGLDHEELRVVLLNTKNVAIAMRTLYVGNLAGSSVRVGEVYRDAVRGQAAAIVVAHNHPSGDPAPSAEDARITADLAAAGRLLDIELLDHVVIGDGRWVSLRGMGMM